MSTKATVGFRFEPHDWHLYADVGDAPSKTDDDVMLYLETQTRCAEVSADGHVKIGLPAHVWRGIAQAVHARDVRTCHTLPKDLP